jgi:hypothetical protein
LLWLHASRATASACGASLRFRRATSLWCPATPLNCPGALALTAFRRAWDWLLVELIASRLGILDWLHPP